jgi:hypothetical protein
MKKMKRLYALALFSICMIGGTAFAQDAANEPQSNLYGYFRLDYDYNKTMADNADHPFDGFNVARARLGWDYRMSDALSSTIELDLFFKQTIGINTAYTSDIRLASVTWKAIENLYISAGKRYRAFAT